MQTEIKRKQVPGAQGPWYQERVVIARGDWERLLEAAPPPIGDLAPWAPITCRDTKQVLGVPGFHLWG